MPFRNKLPVKASACAIAYRVGRALEASTPAVAAEALIGPLSLVAVAGAWPFGPGAAAFE